MRARVGGKSFVFGLRDTRPQNCKYHPHPRGGQGQLLRRDLGGGGDICFDVKANITPTPQIPLSNSSYEHRYALPGGGDICSGDTDFHSFTLGLR